MKKITFAVVAMATALAFVPAAVAGAQVLCPNATATNSNGYGGNSATNVVGTSDATCGPNSAVQLHIPNDNSGYARLEWTQGTGGVPAALTLGTLTGLDASVNFTADLPGDQPFFMITVNDSTDSLGLTKSTDQLMFLEFQPTNLVGTNMAASAGTTLFNMYDNTSDKYLNQSNGGQQDAHPLSYWFTQYPDLSSELITGLRIGIGMDGGCSGPCSETLTINSLDVNPTVSTPESSSLPMFFLSGFVLAGAIFLKGRKSGSLLAA
jgi:hypothetical protein